MAILSVDSLQPAGLTSVTPSIIYILTNDTYATVTATGYLNSAAQLGSTFNDQQMALVYTSDDGPVWLKVVITYSGATILNSVYSLVEISSPGTVILPTIANHIIVSADTAGTLENLTGTAINNGSIQAGLSGTAGTFISFPSAASKGSLILAAVANTGNTNTTISNVAMGQASVISIPDPAGATANFALAPSALVNGNLVKASGTAGLIIDAGISAAAVPTYTSPTIANHIAVFSNTSGNLSEDAATAINGGNIQAGLSGTAGTLASFPSTASKGSLKLVAVANSGDTITTISNASMGQASVITIPDPAGATANFAVAPSALVSGNFVKASGTAGLVVDGGAAIHAGTTGAYGGGGTSNAFSVTGMTGSWIVTATILSQTNAASIVKAVPGSNTLTVTFSADPGANTTINWVALTASI